MIRNQGEMLADAGYSGDGALAENTGRIITDCSAQVLAFVNDILELAKVESGRLEITPQPLDLGDFLRTMVTTIEALAQVGEVTPSITITDALVRIDADPRRLREIVLNLVDNAVKYTPAGGRVDLGVTLDAGVARIHVSDTGVGIPEVVGDRVFEPFFSVKGTSTQRGQGSSGLGLALARRRNHLHRDPAARRCGPHAPQRGRRPRAGGGARRRPSVSPSRRVEQHEVRALRKPSRHD